jgi:curved DNA-binding protein CbpA
MNPYELLGVPKDASSAQIKSAYRRLSKTAHPDAGGDAEKFGELKHAFDVLIDPERRKRFDKTGRMDQSRVTDQALKGFIANLIKSMVNAKDSMGQTDNPRRENLRDKAVLSLKQSQDTARGNRKEIERRLTRAVDLIERFEKSEDADSDPVGDALRDEEKNIRRELSELDDALELAELAIGVFRSYSYKADPDTEGPFASGPAVFRGRVVPREKFDFRY